MIFKEIPKHMNAILSSGNFTCKSFTRFDKYLSSGNFVRNFLQIQKILFLVSVFTNFGDFVPRTFYTNLSHDLTNIRVPVISFAIFCKSFARPDKYSRSGNFVRNFFTIWGQNCSQSFSDNFFGEGLIVQN